MINFFKRLLLKLILGKRTYEYMLKSLFLYRINAASYTDIIVRLNGADKRIEADWLKNINKLVLPEKDKYEKELEGVRAYHKTYPAKIESNE
jgi:hypothetical protein